MQIKQQILPRTRAIVRGVRQGSVVVSMLALGACSIDQVLEVPDPDVATPVSVQEKSALPVLRTGAIGDGTAPRRVVHPCAGRQAQSHAHQRCVPE